MTKPTDYDSKVSDYASAVLSRDDRMLIHVPTAKHFLGDLSNKRILDVGCGEGYFSRLIKEWGAREVMGIDRSKSMIELAMRKEQELNQGIKFREGDLSLLSQEPKKIDLAFAGFVIHYASTVDELFKMMGDISSVLNEQGILVAFLENPFFPLHSGRKFNVETIPLGPLENGSRVKRIHFNEQGKEIFEIIHSHFLPDTYEKAAHQAQFQSVRWESFIRTEVAQLNQTYWDDYFKDFSITVMICSKK